MTPKKKRTRWTVVETCFDLNLDEIYPTKKEAIDRLHVLEKETDFKFKVLRVTLTASPAGWK